MNAALTDLKLYSSTIRHWKSPWGEERFCSITSGGIRSIRVPNHTIRPCDTAKEFHEYLLSAARNSLNSEAVCEDFLASARKLQSLQRPGVYFTHSGIKHHNILVDDQAQVTGLLDWESAGWYPGFWEYTTALRCLPEGYWWY